MKSYVVAVAKEITVSINIKRAPFSVISKLMVKISCSKTTVVLLVTYLHPHWNVGPSIILIAGLDRNLNNRRTFDYCG